MKRWQVVLLEIIILIVAGVIGASLSEHRSAHALTGGVHDLGKVYQEFNTEYFQDKLPKNVVIDFSESGDYMATTMEMSDGRFHIAFNKKYVKAQRTAREIMLHEQCHVKTWNGEMTEEDWETGRHTRQWRACMLNLDSQGAFRRELIDGYNGN